MMSDRSRQSLQDEDAVFSPSNVGKNPTGARDTAEQLLHSYEANLRQFKETDGRSRRHKRHACKEAVEAAGEGLVQEGRRGLEDGLALQRAGPALHRLVEGLRARPRLHRATWSARLSADWRPAPRLQ